MKHNKESFHNTSVTLDCEQCTMVTHHGKPMFTKVNYFFAQLIFNLLTFYALNVWLQVCTEGRLILEFIYDDYMRIKSWHMAVRQHKELIPRTVILHQHSPQNDPNIMEQLSKNITRQGITNSTLNYLRVSGDIQLTSKSKIIFTKFSYPNNWIHVQPFACIFF